MKLTMKSALMLSAMVLGAGTASAECGIEGGSVRILSNDFEALRIINSAAEECASDTVTVTANATAEHKNIQGPALSVDPAEYTVAVVANKGGQKIGAAQARFLVYEQDLELENPAADPTLLASLSSLTGGKALAPEQLSHFLEELRKQPLATEIETETKVTPWDTWPFMFLLVGLMTGEWALRKKWGLV